MEESMNLGLEQTLPSPNRAKDPIEEARRLKAAVKALGSQTAAAKRYRLTQS